MNQQLVRAGLFDLDAETAHTLQGRQAVAPAQKATHPADAIGQGAEQDGAVGNGFVARRPHLAGQCFRPLHGQAVHV